MSEEGLRRRRRQDAALDIGTSARDATARVYSLVPIENKSAVLVMNWKELAH
jgi:hypothetical protein